MLPWQWLTHAIRKAEPAGIDPVPGPVLPTPAADRAGPEQRPGRLQRTPLRDPGRIPDRRELENRTVDDRIAEEGIGRRGRRRRRWRLGRRHIRWRSRCWRSLARRLVRAHRYGRRRSGIFGRRRVAGPGAARRDEGDREPGRSPAGRSHRHGALRSRSGATGSRGVTGRAMGRISPVGLIAAMGASTVSQPVVRTGFANIRRLAPGSE
jgi:hypothetical protein